MRVPARIFASEKLLQEIFRDRSLTQLVNTTTLPGIQQHALVMPDAHEGYGFPIGGVVATSYPDGVISPGGIGYDINCGVRLVRSELAAKDIAAKLEDLAVALYSEVPSGVGQGGPLKLNNSELNELLTKGAKWIVERGWGEQSDLKNIESAGLLPEADPAAVSSHAKERGRDQVGTLGAGNHFVEIDRVEKLYTDDFGLYQDQVVILIHTGSRGLGHQVATDYLRTILQAMPKLGITLPDAELAGAPLSSAEGSAYFAAMQAAANFAWANRQMISWEVKTAWQKVLGKSGGHLRSKSMMARK
jgi:tRNA-splicing ligase RtcB